MARGALLFRERELTRAVRAMAKAGQTVTRVEIGRDGKMVIVVGKPQEPVIEQPAWIRSGMNGTPFKASAVHSASSIGTVSRDSISDVLAILRFHFQDCRGVLSSWRHGKRLCQVRRSPWSHSQTTGHRRL